MNENYKQMGLFEATYPQYRITKPIRLIELFAGIGAQHKALSILGADFESHKVCEWSVNSIIAYNYIHIKDYNDYSKPYSYEELLEKVRGVSADYNKPMTDKQLRQKGEKWIRRLYSSMVAIKDHCPDISRLKGKDLEIELEREREHTYIMTYSFPCIPADGLILTQHGYKKIIDVQVGEKVLTKDGSWQKVVNFFDNGEHDTLKVEAQGCLPLTLTPDHKVWVREKNGKSFSEPKMIPSKDLIPSKHYLGMPIIKNETYGFCEDDWLYLMGAYLGDGWVKEDDRKGVYYGVNEKKAEKIKERLDRLELKYSVYKEDTCLKIRVSDELLKSSCLTAFGVGSHNKTVPISILGLKKESLLHFYQGYLDTDGCELKDGTIQFSTVSKNVALSISAIINKLFNAPTRLYKIKVSPKKTIQGRVVNQSDWYQVRFKTNVKRKISFYENGFVWYPLKRVSQSDKMKVYDIEVENTHSFVYEGAIVSNCQDLSLAGKMKGMSKEGSTRSGLLWQVERILLELNELKQKPDVLIMENVPQVCSGDNIEPFNDWLHSLEKLGYTNYYETINAKDYAIPQSRKRTFMVSILGDYSYTFPDPVKLKNHLKEFLDKDVDEGYYLTDEQTKNFIATDEQDDED